MALLRSVLLLALVVSVGCATSPTSSSSTSTAPAAAPRPIFGWKIEGNGLDQPSYVFGSMHITPAGTVWRTPVVDAALTGARTLFVELDITALDQGQLQRLMVEHGVYLPPDGLSQHITPETFAVITTSSPSLGIPGPAVERMRPWVLTLAAVENIIKGQGWTGEPVDVVAINAAKGANVPVVALESLSDQLMLFANAPDQLQADMFVEMVKQPELTRTALVDGLYTPWRAGDEAGVAATLLASSEDERIREYNRTIFDVRNKRMLDKILPELTVAGSETVVVGAGHLVGTTGLLNGLRERGYQVTQLQDVVPEPAPAAAPAATP